MTESRRYNGPPVAVLYCTYCMPEKTVINGDSCSIYVPTCTGCALSGSEVKKCLTQREEGGRECE